MESEAWESWSGQGCGVCVGLGMGMGMVLWRASEPHNVVARVWTEA